MSEPSDQEKAGISLDKLDAAADRWAEEVDLVSMIRAATAALRTPYVSGSLRAMELQFAAIIRQAFIEGAFRMMSQPITEAEIEAAKNMICGWMDCQASCASDSPEERACLQLARMSLEAAARVRANTNEIGWYGAVL